MLIIELLVIDPVNYGLPSPCPPENLVGISLEKSFTALELRKFWLSAVQIVLPVRPFILGLLFHPSLFSQLSTYGTDLNLYGVQWTMSCFKLGSKDASIGRRAICLIPQAVPAGGQLSEGQIRLLFGFCQPRLQCCFCLLRRSLLMLHCILEQLYEILLGTSCHLEFFQLRVSCRQ